MLIKFAYVIYFLIFGYVTYCAGVFVIYSTIKDVYICLYEMLYVVNYSGYVLFLIVVVVTIRCSFESFFKCAFILFV